MRTLVMMGALVAAGLVFSGCERQPQPAGYSEPTQEGTGGAGEPVNDQRFLEDGRQVDDITDDADRELQPEGGVQPR